MPDLNGEPTNPERAERITTLMSTYDDLLGEVHEEPDALRLASVLTDVRHFCDVHGIDYYEAERTSYQHYLAERPSHG